MFRQFEEGELPSWIYVLFISIYILVFLYGVIYVRKDNLFYDNNNRIKSVIFVCFFIIFAVFYCINSDYFSYRIWVDSYAWILSDFSKEIVYAYIVDLVQGNYELFRLMVWGSALLIVSQCYRIMGAQVFLTMLILFVLFFDRICYARASLGMSIYYLGISIIIYGNEVYSYKHVILGILISLLSFAFHREMIVPILMLPILIPIINTNNFHKLFLLIFIIVVGLAILIGSQADGFFSNDLAGKIEEAQESINEGIYNATSISNYIKLIWRYSIFYLPFFVVTKKIYDLNKREIIVDNDLFSFYKITAAIIVCATALCVVYGFGTIFFYRVLYMTTIPIALLVFKLYQQQYINNNYVILLLGNAALYQINYWYIHIMTH